VLLFARRAGEMVTLTVSRDNKPMQVRLTLDVRPSGQ